jgi:hydrogenase maturation protease
VTVTAVIGLGNPFVTDEGIGIRLVTELAKQYDCAGVDVFELGTASFRIIHLIRDRKKVVIVDCAVMGASPGHIRRFTFQQAKSIKNIKHHSLHEGDLFEIIELAAGEGHPLPEIVFFGVEPVRMELGEGLSPLLEKNIPAYLEKIAAECGLGRRTDDGA